MKYHALRLTASCISVLTWVIVAIGIISSIFLGVRAATLQASIAFLLGGFVLTAIYSLMLFAVSRLIYLFIEMKEDLSVIAQSARNDPES
ncbi:hypothetical protein ACFLUE_01885 [Chloroflexota bacterium]